MPLEYSSLEDLKTCIAPSLCNDVEITGIKFDADAYEIKHVCIM